MLIRYYVTSSVHATDIHCLYHAVAETVPCKKQVLQNGRATIIRCFPADCQNAIDSVAHPSLVWLHWNISYTRTHARTHTQYQISI